MFINEDTDFVFEEARLSIFNRLLQVQYDYLDHIVSKRLLLDRNQLKRQIGSAGFSANSQDKDLIFQIISE